MVLAGAAVIAVVATGESETAGSVAVRAGAGVPGGDVVPGTVVAAFGGPADMHPAVNRTLSTRSDTSRIVTPVFMMV